MLRYVLLALMTDGRAVHGYALMKAFAARSGVRVSIGNVYRELQQLRAGGLIDTAANPTGADSRRCPYVITDKGRSMLKRWLALPSALLAREPVDPLLYRLALLGEPAGTDVTAFIDEIHAELSTQRRAVERHRATVTAARVGEGGGHPILSLLLARRAKRLAVDIELLSELRTAMAAAHSQAARKRARGITRPAGRPGRTNDRVFKSA